MRARARSHLPHGREAQADDDFVVPDDDDGTGAAGGAAAKGGKKKRAPAPFVDAVIAELSSKRKLTVGKFNGAVTIGIREVRASPRTRTRRVRCRAACTASRADVAR